MLRTRVTLLGLAIGFGLVDQASKWLVRASLSPYQPIPLIPDVLQLTLAYNTGAAFSLLRHQPQWLLGSSALILAGLLVYALTRRRFMRGEVPALALIIGGALGNLADRLMAGRVTDFIDVAIIRYPIFNLADTFIFCGVAWLVVLQLRAPGAPTETAPDERP